MFLSKFPFKNKWKNYGFGLAIFGSLLLLTELEEPKVSENCLPCQTESNEIRNFKSCWNLLLWNSCRPRGCRWAWQTCELDIEIPIEVYE